MPRSYRIFKELNYAYFVTWTIVDGLPIFSEDLYRQIALDSLAYLRSHKKTELNAFVIMPSHIHAILWPNEGINLSDVIRDFKRFTSRRISIDAEKQNRTDWLDRFSVARQQNRAMDISRSSLAGGFSSRSDIHREICQAENGLYPSQSRQSRFGRDRR
jgi:REP element-mobilizing transposase RayT